MFASVPSSGYLEESYKDRKRRFGWLLVLGSTAFETIFQSISGRLQRGRKKREKTDDRKMSKKKKTHPHLLQAQ